MQQTLASPGGGRVLTAQSPADRLYKVMRVLVVVLVFFLFIPSLNPARITELINRNMSLFTSGISYSQLTNGFSRAFRRGWVSEGTMRTLQFSALACCLGLIVQCGGMCATLGTTRLKRIGAWVALGGGAAALAGLGCMFASYNTLAHNAYAADLGVRLPVTFFVILALVAVVTVCSAVLPENARSTTCETAAGKVNACRLVQLVNACLPIDCTVSGSIMLRRAVQSANAPYTMSVTFCETRTVSSLLQSANALSLICSTESGMVYVPDFSGSQNMTFFMSAV